MHFMPLAPRDRQLADKAAQAQAVDAFGKALRESIGDDRAVERKGRENLDAQGVDLSDANDLRRVGVLARFQESLTGRISLIPLLTSAASTPLSRYFRAQYSRACRTFS